MSYMALELITEIAALKTGSEGESRDILPIPPRVLAQTTHSPSEGNTEQIRQRQQATVEIRRLIDAPSSLRSTFITRRKMEQWVKNLNPQLDRGILEEVAAWQQKVRNQYGVLLKQK